uniref:Uncharacterized protein n=1 Tax=Anguilla anguilla TaxID=7936 RepID=A0A0E9WHP4_ANGAN
MGLPWVPSQMTQNVLAMLLERFVNVITLTIHGSHIVRTFVVAGMQCGRKDLQPLLCLPVHQPVHFVSLKHMEISFLSFCPELVVISVAFIINSLDTDGNGCFPPSNVAGRHALEDKLYRF